MQSDCVDYYAKLLGCASLVLIENNIGLIRYFTIFRCDEATKSALRA